MPDEDARDFGEFGMGALPLMPVRGEFEILGCRPGFSGENITPSVEFRFRVAKSLDGQQGEPTPWVRRYIGKKDGTYATSDFRKQNDALFQAWGNSPPSLEFSAVGFQDPKGEFANWAKGFEGRTVFGRLGNEEYEGTEKNTIAGWGRMGGRHHQAFLKKWQKRNPSGDTPKSDIPF